jgi:hypothetical protein
MPGRRAVYALGKPIHKPRRKGPPRDGPDVLPMPAEPRPGKPLKCVRCKVPLSLAQPDQTRPFRLVGACEACGRVHLVDSFPFEGPQLLVVGEDFWSAGSALAD